jgi:hypothetical protein
MGQEGDQRKQAEQGRSGAGNGRIRPLALGFHAQMGAHLMKGDFHPPAADEPGQDLERHQVEIGRQHGLGLETAQRIADNT